MQLLYLTFTLNSLFGFGVLNGSVSISLFTRTSGPALGVLGLGPYVQCGLWPFARRTGSLHEIIFAKCSQQSDSEDEDSDDE